MRRRIVIQKKMDLLISLGHNSSCIALEDGEIIAAYEQERLDKIKSSSAFPKEAIREAISFATKPIEGLNLYLSYWYDDYDFWKHPSKKHEKHWDKNFIEELKKEAPVKIWGLKEFFTHHSAHAYSVISFFENHYKGNLKDFKAHIFVSDGFGNKQEVISIYELEYDASGIRNVLLLRKIKGYQNSLGLLYQYATSYCGMKENMDEYKFLGYESHIKEILSEVGLKIIQEKSEELAKNIFDSNFSFVIEDKVFINTNALKNAKDYFSSFWFEHILNILVEKKELDLNWSQYEKKCIIGHFIQEVIEKFHTLLIEKYKPTNVLLAGGLYYNVKLNNSILKQIPDGGKFCVTPLAGDQGAAIGNYEIHNPHKFQFKDLLWGKRRDLNGTKRLNGIGDNPNIHHGNYWEHIFPAIEDMDSTTFFTFDNQEDYEEFIIKRILNNDIVNVFQGNMEFGPRGLTHTCTLALPTDENVKIINEINGRDKVMPFAPAILKENLDKLFEVSNVNVVGSDNYMIVTYDYKNDIDFQQYGGVMHPYPLDENKYSGRPQVIRDKSLPIYNILKKIEGKTKACISTSFNIHGCPIVYSIKDALNSFNYQVEKAKELGYKSPYLIIGTF